MSVTHLDIRKAQPWRKLLLIDTEDHSLSNIYATTDKPWARPQLAEECEAAVLGPRQHRHPEYEQYPRPDSSPKMYKAEACKQEPHIKGEGRAENDVDEGALRQRLSVLQAERASLHVGAE
ncbi:hypothetical protein PG991_015883 [Apiospora marii]|uniref:Uncharacterized protein n=1 Tax=Apiospora marii TaxID=335849 RepID=A0ABR1R015_9PEZI